jgi:virginiamycin B lyase
MLQKQFVVLLGLVFGLGVLSACSSQVVPAPAPPETPAAEPATASLPETAAMPEAEATIEQPAPEVAQPAGGLEEATTTPDGQPGEMAVEQDNQPAETLTVQIDATRTATAEPGQDQPAPACDGELEPTASNAEGPYYKSGAPERAVLVEPDMIGTRLLLTGQVLTTDCQPVPGALLDFWQANDQGEYDNVGYTLRGRQVADEIGRYRLETIMPARYPGRPPHIHVKVNAPGGPVLTTQIYFEGQPGNEGDGLILPSLVVALTDTPGGGKAATFNFVLISEKAAPVLQEYPIPPGSHPHDVAPAPDGSVWYTAQGAGELGRLDPNSGETRHIALGAGSAPHGVIVGPDGAPWITDGGLNAIVRVDPGTEEIQRFPLPEGSGYANLNTATFDQSGVLWFTGQSGVYGRLDPERGQVEVFQAPRGRGPYGISTTPDGVVYYASLAGSHIARLDLETGAATILEPPTPGQGARRVWPDSQGRVWVSEWNGGQVAVYDPATDTWQEWRLPGDSPRPYAVYVDEQDMVWLSDFGANALVRFDPLQETFEVFTLPSPGADVRQLLGRPGEVWGAESGTDKLVVIRTR